MGLWVSGFMVPWSVLMSSVVCVKSIIDFSLALLSQRFSYWAIVSVNVEELSSYFVSF